MKRLVATLMTTLLVLSLNRVALANERQGRPSTKAVVTDLLIRRPLGFAGTILGTTAFVVSLPVTLGLRKVDQTEKILVKDPFNYTFERRLGEK